MLPDFSNKYIGYWTIYVAEHQGQIMMIYTQFHPILRVCENLYFLMIREMIGFDHFHGFGTGRYQYRPFFEIFEVPTYRFSSVPVGTVPTKRYRPHKPSSPLNKWADYLCMVDLYRLNSASLYLNFEILEFIVSLRNIEKVKYGTADLLHRFQPTHQIFPLRGQYGNQ